LNKRRLQQGRFAIPAHTSVQTRDYVTQYNHHKATSKGEYKGGHHASPIAHWRKAHKRNLADGRIIDVKSSKVNWRDMEELHRMFYRVKEN
jgi:hypothetical protein